MAVVPTSIAPPRYPRIQIHRERIAALVDTVDESRVTTLYAPAGYGKTVALLQWSRALSGRGRPVLWLAARAASRQAVRRSSGSYEPAIIANTEAPPSHFA